MKPVDIVVYEYNDVMTGARDELETPRVYYVSAYCVGGSEGIRAYFRINDSLCEAHGDDGHWRLVSVCHVDWLDRIKETINSINFS